MFLVLCLKKDSADWHIELSSAIKDFLCDTGLTRAKVAMQYKYVDDEFNEEYLSKGLAVLYNFLQLLAVVVESKMKET